MCRLSVHSKSNVEQSNLTTSNIQWTDVTRNAICMAFIFRHNTGKVVSAILVEAENFDWRQSKFSASTSLAEITGKAISFDINLFCMSVPYPYDRISACWIESFQVRVMLNSIYSRSVVLFNFVSYDQRNLQE